MVIILFNIRFVQYVIYIQFAIGYLYKDKTGFLLYGIMSDGLTFHAVPCLSHKHLITGLRYNLKMVYDYYVEIWLITFLIIFHHDNTGIFSAKYNTQQMREFHIYYIYYI